MDFRETHKSHMKDPTCPRITSALKGSWILSQRLKESDCPSDIKRGIPGGAQGLANP